MSLSSLSEASSEDKFGLDCCKVAEVTAISPTGGFLFDRSWIISVFVPIDDKCVSSVYVPMEWLTTETWVPTLRISSLFGSLSDASKFVRLPPFSNSCRTFYVIDKWIFRRQMNFGANLQKLTWISWATNSCRVTFDWSI